MNKKVQSDSLVGEEAQSDSLVGEEAQSDSSADPQTLGPKDDHKSDEEKLLIKQYGKEYKEYMKKVPWRMIPKIF